MRAGLAHEETLRILARGPGLQVFIAMRPAGSGKWSGQLYNTDDGMTVSGNLIDSGPAVLRVDGCVGGLCDGENLTRVGR